MPLTTLLVLSACVAQVPVLLDPVGARQVARAVPATADVPARLRAAETLLLGRQSGEAAAVLDALPPIEDPGLAARAEALRLDVAVARRDDAAVREGAERLRARPGWEAHAARQSNAGLLAQDRRWWGLFGSVTFSLALALAMIGGARELLRPRAPTLVVAAVAVVAVLVASAVSPVLARVVALADLAVVALAHAAYATLLRSAPGPRLRVFLAAVVLAGTAGIVIAVLAPLPWAFVLGEL